MGHLSQQAKATGPLSKLGLSCRLYHPVYLQSSTNYAERQSNRPQPAVWRRQGCRSCNLPKQAPLKPRLNNYHQQPYLCGKCLSIQHYALLD